MIEKEQGCPTHPQAGRWEHSDGLRCAICGYFYDGRAVVQEPAEVRYLDTYQERAALMSGMCVPEGVEMYSARLAMGGLGLAGEAWEVVDLLKKHLFHGHPLDTEKLTRELGDVLWYVAELSTALGVKLSIVAQRNLEKLAARYPDGFDPARSQNREAE